LTAHQVRGAVGDSVEAVAREWFTKFSTDWAESHSSKVIGRLEKDVFPWLSATPPRIYVRVTPSYAALRRMGFMAHEHTAHGFRSMASTLLNEQGYNENAIERQLSRGERAKYLPERKRMMQGWPTISILCAL
jgi:hypothetical protein